MILPCILFISVAVINTIARSNSSRKLFFFLHFQVTVDHWGTRAGLWRQELKQSGTICPAPMGWTYPYQSLINKMNFRLDYSQFVEDTFSITILFSQIPLVCIELIKQNINKPENKTKRDIGLNQNFLFLKFEVSKITFEFGMFLLIK